VMKNCNLNGCFAERLFLWAVMCTEFDGYAIRDGVWI
jgi:hypothetical protein